MKSLHLLPIFALLLVSGIYRLKADEIINVDTSALGTRQPGESGTPFHFTTEADGEVTVKAMFMTHWLTSRTNVVSNPKATSIVIDGKGYPSGTGGEDFYGYMDGRVWPERVTQVDQTIWIQETVSLRKGEHTIEFRNGLMERDDSRSRTTFSYAGWMTATLTLANANRPVVIAVKVDIEAATASILPTALSVNSDTPASFHLNSTGATRTSLSGTDGTKIVDPKSEITLRLTSGSYSYRFWATGKGIVRWIVEGSEQIWIDLPSGISVNVTTNLNYTATENGDYTLRAVAGSETTTAPFHVDLPTTIATATLIVTAGPGPSGVPEVTEFSPAAASYTVTSGAAEGHTYERSWKAGEAWTAYLGRDGVAFRVVGRSSAGVVDRFEVQAKSPSKEWFTLTSASPLEGVNNGPGISVSQALTARLGEVNREKPLLPADPSLTGTWTIRARVRDITGAWSPWAFEQPLNVIYPIKDVVKNAKTLPPAEDADWFTASPEKTYVLHVLVP